MGMHLSMQRYLSLIYLTCRSYLDPMFFASNDQGSSCTYIGARLNYKLIPKDLLWVAILIGMSVVMIKFSV